MLMTLHDIAVSRSRPFTVTTFQSRAMAHALTVVRRRENPVRREEGAAAIQGAAAA
jgi:hypothetical protein